MLFNLQLRQYHGTRATPTTCKAENEDAIDANGTYTWCC